jgi:uncharacterized ferredoxin-like protein
MTMKDTVRMVGELMAVAARTAPKAVGKDFIEVMMLSDSERIALGNDMVLVGKPHKGVGLNCGACGYASCEEFNGMARSGDFEGPNCAIRLLDLGIALGSAAKIASELNVDSRVMYRVGVSAKRLKMSGSRICHGIPLSATGKSIFFDRPVKPS